MCQHVCSIHLSRVSDALSLHLISSRNCHPFTLLWADSVPGCGCHSSPLLPLLTLWSLAGSVWLYAARVGEFLWSLFLKKDFMLLFICIVIPTGSHFLRSFPAFHFVHFFPFPNFYFVSLFQFLNNLWLACTSWRESLSPSHVTLHYSPIHSGVHVACICWVTSLSQALFHMQGT